MIKLNIATEKRLSEISVNPAPSMKLSAIATGMSKPQ